MAPALTGLTRIPSPADEPSIDESRTFEHADNGLANLMEMNMHPATTAIKFCQVCQCHSFYLGGIEGRKR